MPGLARGDVPVVLADFSTGADAVTVGGVTARWSLSQATRPAGQLLSRRMRRLGADGAHWLDTAVTVEERDAVLPW